MRAERRLERRQVGVDVGDDRDALSTAGASYPLTIVNSIDICRSMAVDLELVPKQKRAAGEPCCEPVVYPDVEREQAARMAEVAKALGDPIRLQLVDVLRKHAGKVCVCELVPLFDISQPTLSPPPQEAARRRHRRLRAPRPVGLLLRHPRRAGGADRMAELSRPRTTGCCAPEAQETCCEPAAKDACCATSAAGGGCGCAAGQDAARPRPISARPSASATPPRPAPRSRPRAAAPATCRSTSDGDEVFGAALYDDADAERRPRRRRAAPRSAAACPTAVADLHEGETVLDLGSGAGADVLISARRVGPTGKAIGLDMTDEMLDLARANAAAGRRGQRRVRQGLHRGHPARPTPASTW